MHGDFIHRWRILRQQRDHHQNPCLICKQTEKTLLRNPAGNRPWSEKENSKEPCYRRTKKTMRYMHRPKSSCRVLTKTGEHSYEIDSPYGWVRLQASTTLRWRCTATINWPWARLIVHLESSAPRFESLFKLACLEYHLRDVPLNAQELDNARYQVYCLFLKFLSRLVVSFLQPAEATLRQVFPIHVG